MSEPVPAVSLGANCISIEEFAAGHADLQAVLEELYKAARLKGMDYCLVSDVLATVASCRGESPLPLGEDLWKWVKREFHFPTRYEGYRGIDLDSFFGRIWNMRNDAQRWLTLDSHQ